MFILMSMYVKWYSGMYTGIHGPTHPDPQRRNHTLPSIMGRRLRKRKRKTEAGREINRERERHGGGGVCRFAASLLINLDNILSYESFHSLT